MTSAWIIGTGNMAIEYAKILKDLRIHFSVIGRGCQSAEFFASKTGINPITGGIDSFLSNQPQAPKYCIIAVDCVELKSVLYSVIRYGVKYILVEKPAALTIVDLEGLVCEAQKYSVCVLVAYNRRFFASVRQAREIIVRDGGIKSFHFEFTEWSHVIENLEAPDSLKNKWLVANSSHVIDLAFFLGGTPSDLCTFHSGSTPWHPSGAVFTGAGKTIQGSLFSYCANWNSAGRWGIELLTEKHKLILRPLEKLFIQDRGNIAIKEIESDNTLDTEYKPGLFHQTQHFINCDFADFCTLRDQLHQFEYYYKIAGYQDEKNIHC